VKTSIEFNDAHKNLPVIFLTGCGDAELRERALELGALGHIVKPFSPEELRAQVLSRIEDAKQILISH
jgi:DNA-binding response OmpR family regulator